MGAADRSENCKILSVNLLDEKAEQAGAVRSVASDVGRQEITHVHHLHLQKDVPQNVGPLNGRPRVKNSLVPFNEQTKR